MLKISVIIICYNRRGELKECISSVLKQTKYPDEIIVVDNNSTDGTETLFTNEEFSPSSLIKYFKLEKNMGVAGGRNYGIKKASGDILVFIDDDALLKPEDALRKIADKFEKGPDTGILAFKIVDYDTKIIQGFPHIDKSLDPNKEFETSYFLGGATAVRKEVFKKCGPYPEDYFYSFEELDLGFRAIDKGYRIFYFPEVFVWHRRSPKGRMSDDKKWINTYRNRLAVSYKYLKNRHLFIIAFIWFIKILKESRSLVTPFRGFFAFISLKKRLKRQPISNASIEKLKTLKGRIWY